MTPSSPLVTPPPICVRSLIQQHLLLQIDAVCLWIEGLPYSRPIIEMESIGVFVELAYFPPRLWRHLFGLSNIKPGWTKMRKDMLIKRQRLVLWQLFMLRWTKSPRGLNL